MPPGARRGHRLRLRAAGGNPCGMRIVRDHRYVAPGDRGAAAAIGNFDGVHLGHISVIDLARQEARRLSAPARGGDVRAPPARVLCPDTRPFRLMGREARAHRLEKLGIARLYELNFNAALSSLPARAFARDVLADGLGLRHVVVGEDFRFGKGRDGGAAELEAFGAEMGFGVTLAPLAGRRWRAGLLDRDPHRAERRAAARRGGDAGPLAPDRGRGDRWRAARPRPGLSHRQHVHRRAAPAAFRRLRRAGRYARRPPCRELPRRRLGRGAPDVRRERPNLETHIFDFSGDLYGAHLSVALVEFLRPEESFDSVDALVAQMDTDCARARAFWPRHDQRPDPPRRAAPALLGKRAAGRG